MNFLSKINNKLKIIILVLYTALAIVIAFLFLNAVSKDDILEGYDIYSNNEYVNVGFRVQEQRKSSEQNESESEKSSFKIYAYIEKKAQEENVKLSINNIKIYVAGTNSSGKFLFDEPSSSSTKQISENGKSAYYESNISSNDVFTKTVSGSVITDNTPKKLYFKVIFSTYKKVDNGDNDISYYETNEEIKYEFNVNNFKIEKAESFETREKVMGTNLIINNSEPYDLQIKKSVVETNNVDKYNFIISLNQPNLGEKLVKNITIEVYGIVKNDIKDKDNLFSDYIFMYGYYGSLISSTASNVIAEIAQSYNLTELIVVSRVTYNDSTIQNINYKVNV